MPLRDDVGPGLADALEHLDARITAVGGWQKLALADREAYRWLLQIAWHLREGQLSRALADEYAACVMRGESVVDKPLEDNKASRRYEASRAEVSNSLARQALRQPTRVMAADAEAHRLVWHLRSADLEARRYVGPKPSVRAPRPTARRRRLAPRRARAPSSSKEGSDDPPLGERAFGSNAEALKAIRLDCAAIIAELAEARP
jgi:hypothetical protein